MTAEHIDRVGVPLIKCNGKYKVAQAYIKVDGAYKLIESTDVSIKVRSGHWGTVRHSK
ncbi:hypothetical protein AHP1_2781 [Aeromonas phage Ahp1_CNU-2021]|nr:hypothetical protein AHP1_2781 [Aeromonas phage Ahp1_CNU-2021]